MAIVGRERELNLFHAALVQSAEQSKVVLIDAEAGAGKSAFLRAAIDTASATTHVLASRPTVAERDLPYAALGDLLATVDNFDDIAPPLRRTLQRVLLRDEGECRGDDSTTVDARTVGLACVAVWERLAADRPLMIMIDDIQWLDAASAASLAFSFRRLPAAGVLVVCARRAGETSVELPAETLTFAQLNDEAISSLVTTDTAISAPQLRRVVATARGNPLYALELAREVGRHPLATDDPLTIPATLTSLIADRLGAIAPEVRAALLHAALAARPDVRVMRPLGVLDGLAIAEQNGLVTTASGRVVFAHPLFAAAILDVAPPITRREIHRRLAGAVELDEERVRHLALAAEEPDAALAIRLHETAQLVANRGAFDHAAELAVLAARLTPPGAAELADHSVTAAHLTFQRGDAPTAMATLAGLDLDSARSSTTVRAYVLWATLEFGVGSSIEARRLGLRALGAATTDAERIDAHTILARVSYEHFPTALNHAEQALALIEGPPGVAVADIVLANAISAVVGNRFISGLGLDRALFERAIELEQGVTMSASDTAFASMAALLKIADELDDARTMLESLLSSTEDEGSIPYALSHLPQLELWTGNWDAAEDVANRHLEAAVRTGQRDQQNQANNNLALINAYRGDTTTAAEMAQALMDVGRENGDLWTERSGAGLLGFIALSDGDAQRAVELLSRSEILADEMGLHEPGYRRLRADLIEALVATGRIDEAQSNAEAMWLTADRLGRVSSRAVARRMQSLVAAARGDRDLGVALAAEAVEQIATTPLVFEHARALLTQGQVHRRFKEKAAARSALQAALEIFERLGAQRFAERARRDLARIGLRPTASLGLTETERRVAELAATGRTVRQVGDELYISAKTVEANLTRVYRKLGLRGRAELATWMAGQTPNSV